MSLSVLEYWKKGATKEPVVGSLGLSEREASPATPEKAKPQVTKSGKVSTSRCSIIIPVNKPASSTRGASTSENRAEVANQVKVDNGKAVKEGVKKAPLPVKKPAGGAFGAWMSENRTAIANQVKAEGGKGLEDIAKKASALWGLMSESEKKPWLAKYEEQKAAYEKYQEALDYEEEPEEDLKDLNARASCTLQLASCTPAAKTPARSELGVKGFQPAKRPADHDSSASSKVAPAAKRARQAKPQKSMKNVAITPRLGVSGWQLFTPRFVNPKLCMARTWAAGYGCQCTKGVLEGSQLCRLHSKEDALAYGRVDGPIPEPKMKEFMKVAASRI